MAPPLAVFESITSLSPGDWAWVALASAVIMAILGPRLWRDIRRMRSAPPPEG